MKAIILARVSNEEQLEGQSIPAQLARAQDYCHKRELKIKSEYCFDESSTKDQRKKFEQIINEIKQAKEPMALVVETVDRLQRSFKESVLLDELRKAGKLHIHFIRENLVIHKDSNSSEIQRWDLAVFVAKSYVLQLSDNVKRSNEYKRKNGEWAGKAPIGYLNSVDDKNNKTVVADPMRGHLITRMFELYATGNYSMLTLRKEMKKLGLVSNTKNPIPLTVSSIFHALKNPFYFGLMLVKGQLYPHKYQTLVSKELFEQVQQVKAGYHKKPFQYAAKPFVFRGLIKCADPKCACTITPEISKGHTYYSCTNYKKVHANRVYVTEAELLEPIQQILKSIQLPNEIIDFLITELRKSNEAKNHFNQQALNTLRTEYDKIEARLSKMLDARFDGSITTDIYDKKLHEYKERQQELLDEMQQHNVADESYYITVNTVLNLAQKAYEIFESSELQEKRQLLNFLLQNCTLDGKTLHYELKKPFDLIAVSAQQANSTNRKSTTKSDAHSIWLGSWDCYRTLE